PDPAQPPRREGPRPAARARHRAGPAVQPDRPRSVHVAVTDRPLEGVRVLDLTRVVAGPHSTRLLAELGTDVIKLEPPEGDQTRGARTAGYPSPPGFVQLNLGKRLIAVDLAQPAGRDLVRRLAGAVDVLMENFRPGVMAAWGLDYG